MVKLQPVRLLFVTYGGGHVEIIIRLIPFLKQIANVQVRILALTTAGPRLDRSGISYRTCSDYLPLLGYDTAMAIGAELSADLWDETTGISWEESCAYLGISMIDLQTEIGEAEAQSRYRKDGRSVFCPKSFLSEVLHKECPQLVITTCHVRMERAAVLAARHLGIPIVRIEDLFGYSLLGEYSTESPPRLLPEAEWPDDVIVLNSEVKTRLVEAGFPSERIHPLGQPVLSEWLNAYVYASPSAELEDWRSEGRPVISYATPARRDVLYSYSNALLDVAKRRPEWGICIKLHPSVGLGEFLAYYPKLPRNVRVLSEKDILPVVKASTVVVIFRSTVGLLCLSSGVPLLVVDDTGEPEVMPYVSSGAARGLASLDKLEQTLAEMLADEQPNNHNFVSPLFEIPAGASERIAQWLVERARK